MTGVIALAIEHIAKDFYCINITQSDIIQTPYRLTRERGFSDYHTLAKYPSVGRVSAMVLCCHVQSHKNRPVCWYASWNFAHSSTVFRSLNELIPLTSSVEVAGSSTLPAHKNTYELEHRNCVIKMFFQHQSVTHLP